MGKDENPKRKGGAEKKKKFGKKTAPTTYEADKRRIKDFCERPENRDVEGLSKLAKTVCEALRFGDKSFDNVKNFIQRSNLVPASGKAASNKPKKLPNDLLATHPTVIFFLTITVHCPHSFYRLLTCRLVRRALVKV